MYFYKPQENTETSFSILKTQLQQQTHRKRIQERNQIKINKRKLPSDFFKRSNQRSLPRKLPLDPYLNRLSNHRTTVLIKQPQTELKITSSCDLAPTELDHTFDFTLSKTSVLPFEDQKNNIYHRRILVKQINPNNDHEELFKLQKSTDYVKPKLFRNKQPAENLQTKKQFQNLIKRRVFNKVDATQFEKPNTQRSEIYQMGCTFGKGFKQHGNLSLQNSIMLKNQNEHSPQCLKQNCKAYRYEAINNDETKQKQEKSTQGSQIIEGLKSNQNSPLTLQKGRKQFSIADQTPHFEHPKVNKIYWNIYNHDLSFFQELSMQKSKDVFTAEQKQRKTKYRVNNSSSEYRERVIRKDKKLGQINLPRINKALNIPLDRCIQ